MFSILTGQIVFGKAEGGREELAPMYTAVFSEDDRNLIRSYDKYKSDAEAAPTWCVAVSARSVMVNPPISPPSAYRAFVNSEPSPYMRVFAAATF